MNDRGVSASVIVIPPLIEIGKGSFDVAALGRVPDGLGQSVELGNEFVRPLFERMLCPDDRALGFATAYRPDSAATR